MPLLPQFSSPVENQAPAQLSPGETAAVPINKFKFCTACSPSMHHSCHLRTGHEWEEALDTPCLHVSGRKVPDEPEDEEDIVMDVKPKASKPNVVFILTDDQDRILGPNDYTGITEPSCLATCLCLSPPHAFFLVCS